MVPKPTIQDACVKYIQAVFRAKDGAETADDFWANRRADKAYRRLFEAIANNTPTDVKWQMAMWEIAGSTAEHVWEQDETEQDIVKWFCRIVNECLDDLTAADWIA